MIHQGFGRGRRLSLAGPVPAGRTKGRRRAPAARGGHLEGEDGGGQGVFIRGGDLTLGASWHQEYINTLDRAGLQVTV